MSLGGVLGGLFNALIAPILFRQLGMVEYPLALVLAAVVRPRSEEPGNGSRLRVADVLLVLAAARHLGGARAGGAAVRDVAERAESTRTRSSARLLRGGLMFGLPAVAAFALVRRPARYALSLAALFVAGSVRSRAARRDAAHGAELLRRGARHQVAGREVRAAHPRHDAARQAAHRRRRTGRGR